MTSKANQVRSLTCDAIFDRLRAARQSTATRKSNSKFCSSDALDDPRHEALARFMAFPREVREFKSLTDLAKSFNLSRQTIQRWKHYTTVRQRASWLSMCNKDSGDMLARRAWPRIVAAQVRAAIAGDTQAAKFCAERAWHQESQPNAVPEPTLEDFVANDGSEDDSQVSEWIVETTNARRAEENGSAWLVKGESRMGLADSDCSSNDPSMDQKV